jgi:hypothetical protein
MELVKRVGALGARLRASRDASGERAALARRGLVGFIKATTVVTRQMQRLPMPPVREPERLALGFARDQLVAMRGAMEAAAPLDPEKVGDPNTPEGALTELMNETLALVDAALARDAEIGQAREKQPDRALPESSDPEVPRRVRF